MKGLVNRLLASQSLLLANRVAPIISTTLLASFVVSSMWNGKKVTTITQETEPKFQLSPLQKWLVTAWI